jgi:hypothetical protein
MRIKPTARKIFLFSGYIFLSLLFSKDLYAGNGLQAPEDNKVYKTYRLKDKKPEINGLPDENFWRESGWKTGFTQRNPDEGANATQNTEFSIVYDDNYIYVAFRLYDDEKEKIDRRISRRDTWGGDAAVIYIDSYYDKQTAFMFGVTAGGVKNDGIASGNSEHADMNWDPIWYAKTALTDYGWSAEMRIPLSELRFPEKKVSVWGLQAARYIYRNDEYVLWQHIPQDEAEWAGNFGELHGITDISQKKQIQLTPYVSGKLDMYEADADNPFSGGADPSANAGVNGKIGITNNMILDFAVNPDFGQIEADPSEVNLSAHESYFSEKRPFFIEGKSITDYRITGSGHSWTRDNLLYSRRIGRSPQFAPSVSDGVYYKTPNYIKIPFAAKLTGKTANGWSLGIIDAVTARTYATIDSAGEIRKESVEPFTNYFAARVQKDINKGSTQIGGMLTSVNRDIRNEALKQLPKNAYTGGLDFKQYFDDFRYFVSGKFVASTVNGDAEAINNLQLSSVRYFQRPDAQYLVYDPRRKSLSGTGASIEAGKDASKGWRFRFNVTYRSPGLELNDIGYLRSADAIYQYFWSGYKITDEFLVFQTLDFTLNQWVGWDFGGNKTIGGQQLAANMQFLNKWSFYANYSREEQSRSNGMLRGGPAFLIPPNRSNFIRLRSDPTKMLYASVAAYRKDGLEDNFSYRQLSANLKIQPNPRINVSVDGLYNISNNAMQYISAFEQTDESLYIFGEIEQRTFSFNLNVAFNISPDISLQYYGAPFVSSALYSDFKRITDGTAQDYYERYAQLGSEQLLYRSVDNEYIINAGQNDELAFGNPDFNFKQFRSNFVFRWEYRPGSQFYLVWSQDRTGSLSDGSLGLGESLDGLFRLDSRDIFLFKLSYLIST